MRFLEIKKGVLDTLSFIKNLSHTQLTLSLSPLISHAIGAHFLCILGSELSRIRKKMGRNSCDFVAKSGVLAHYEVMRR